MHRLVLAALAAEDLVRAIREHLVDVHVVRRAGARLIRIDDELRVVLPREHLVGRLRRSRRPVFASSRPVSRCVSAAAFLIQTCDRTNGHSGLQPADRKVLQRANGLHAVERIVRNGQRTEGILLRSRVGRHDHSSMRRCF